jgi:hypothetical protein
MLDAGGGGGGGGTNWNASDMATMWATLANQDTAPHWKMLSGWQTSYELTWQHLNDVKRYKENLIGAWSPEKSPAAAAYVERLDTLITHLQGTYDAAVANHTAFSAATVALADTRTKLKALYDEYVTNQGKIDQFHKTMASSSGGLSGQSAKKNLKPPVTDDRQQQLTWQARSLMFGLSSEVTQAHTSITKPTRYSADQYVDREKEYNSGSAYVPPVLPPLFNADSGSGSSRVPVGGSSHVTPNVSGGIGMGSGSTIGQPGLVLGGTSPTPVINPPTFGPGIAPQPPITPQGNGIINPPIGLPGLPGSGALPPVTNVMPGGTNASGLVKPGIGGAPNGGMRPMPPGGIIGAMPGGGLGQPGAGGRTAQRISPVGGVISPAAGLGRPGAGGTGAGGSGGSRPGTPMSAMGGLGGRAAGRHGEGNESSRWDPDNPWQTDEGVAPIVLPSQEQRVDPGPAIGFDR